MPDLAIRTTSHPGDIRSRCNLITSRRSRFTRLRATALPIRLLTEKPKRLFSNAFLDLQSTTILLEQQHPSPCTRRKSADLVRRCCLGNTPDVLLVIPLLMLRVHSQGPTSLRPPGLEHVTPTLGGHALAKTVNLLTTTLLRLPCSLGHFILYSFSYSKAVKSFIRLRILYCAHKWTVKSPSPYPLYCA